MMIETQEQLDQYARECEERHLLGAREEVNRRGTFYLERYGYVPSGVHQDLALIAAALEALNA